MARRRTIRPGRRLDLAFWALLAFALLVGGSYVAAGVPVLARMFLPEGRAEAHSAYADFPHSVGQPSRHTTQVLQPVEARESPDWLVASRSNPLTPVSTRPSPGRTPLIAIVIDDMGSDVAQSRRAIDLPSAITLSVLPYPQAAPALARSALRNGHEVLVHVPMEPQGSADPGPNALRTGLSPEENIRRLEWSLSRIEGYDGINNHEGSRFSSDAGALAPIIETLAQRRLFFLDSRTSPDTEVVRVARAFGVMSAGRDVFLDDKDVPELIDGQLRLTERVAREKGVAIAIGHPRENTLDALWRWTGELSSRGFRLIPVREAVRLKTLREIRSAALR